MKVNLILLSIFIHAALFAQFPGRIKHFIIFRNHDNFRMTTLGEKTRVSLSTNRNNWYEGMIQRISADTLFLNDTAIRAKDIREMFSPAFFKTTDPFHRLRPSTLTPWYASYDKKWEIVIPPDSVCKDFIYRHVYFHNLERSIRIEKRKTQAPLFYNNFIKFNLAKLFHLEIAFSYERVFWKNWSWETEISYIIGVHDAGAYYTINYPLYNYNGFSITTYPKVFINGTLYLSPVLMYKYLFFTSVRTGWPDGEDSGELQDQYRNDFGLSIRIGTMRRSGHFVYDFYAGLGVKGIDLHQLVYGVYSAHDESRLYWYNPDHSANILNKFLIYPLVNFGVKIGIGF